MDIKKLVEQIRSQVDGETAEKINATLAEIEAGTLSIIDEAKAYAGESKKRKLEIRSLKETVDDLTAERDKFKTELENDSTAEEIESLRQFKQTTVERQKKSVISKLQAAQKSDKWEKAKSLFDVPEKLEEMTEEQLLKNAAEMDKLETIGYFGEANTTVDVHGNPVTAETKTLVEKIGEAKTIAELEALQEENDL